VWKSRSGGSIETVDCLGKPLYIAIRRVTVRFQPAQKYCRALTKVSIKSALYQWRRSLEKARFLRQMHASPRSIHGPGEWRQNNHPTSKQQSRKPPDVDFTKPAFE